MQIFVRPNYLNFRVLHVGAFVLCIAKYFSCKTVFFKVVYSSFIKFSSLVPATTFQVKILLRTEKNTLVYIM